MEAVAKFFSSTRALLALVVLVSASVFVVTGHLEIAKWVDFTQTVFAVYVPSETVAVLGASYLASKERRAPVEAETAKNNAAAAVATASLAPAVVAPPVIVQMPPPAPAPGTTTTTTTPGFVVRELVASIAVIAMVFGFVAGTAMVLASGCGPKSRMVLGDIIDCTKPNTKALVDEFAPVLDQVLVRATTGDGSIDWASVKDATKSFGMETGGCVLSTVIARALKPTTDQGGSSPVHANADDLRRGFEEIRASQLEGKRFKTVAGEL